MSKVLKRPMFRGGGAVNAQGMGIMSGLEPRMNYAQAGQVLPYSETLEKQKRIQDILKTDFKTAEDFGKEYDTYVESLDPTMLFGIDEFGPGSYGESLVEKQRIASSPEVKQSFIAEKLAEQQKVIDEARALGIGTEQIPDIDKKEPDKREAKILEKPVPKIETEDKIQKPTQSDLKTVYEDLLPLFEKELGPDADEARRQKYMQLAKFGLGLLAQPGGSLAEAVGKAGAEPLAGLEAAAARESEAKRAPRLAALQAALKEAEPGKYRQAVNDLVKMGIPKERAIKIITEQGTGTREQLKANIIKADEAALSSEVSEDAARKIAVKISKIPNKDYSDFSKLPKDKQGNIDTATLAEIGEGYYYDEDGKVYSLEKGTLKEIK